LAEGDFGLLNSSSLQPIPSVLNPTNAPPAKPTVPVGGKPASPSAQ
jgi:hypothetical protein